MAYKRNPMRAERMCSIARFAMALPAAASQTAATQWLERTLDDSAVRRMVLPQAFLAVDALLTLYLNVVPGLVVNPPVIARHVASELPFMATENLMMAAVQLGGDRQDLHEVDPDPLARRRRPDQARGRRQRPGRSPGAATRPSGGSTSPPSSTPASSSADRPSRSTPSYSRKSSRSVGAIPELLGQRRDVHV